MTARTAFVTGATGFLGLNLVAELVAGGWRVVALHRAGSRLDDLARFPVERAVADVTDLEALRRAMPEQPDAVFHVAGDTSVWSRERERQRRTNVEGTRQVVRVARERGARRLVHTSSIAAFGPQAGPLDERRPSTAPRSRVNYARTKWEAELEVRAGIARGLDAVLLNPANVVGPFDRSNWSRLFRLVREGALPGAMPGTASWCDARAVARAHLAAFERGRRGESYLLGGADASYAEVLALVGELVGRRPPARVLPAWVLRTVAAASEAASRVTGRAPDLTPDAVQLMVDMPTCDSGKAIRELGYEPASLRAMFTACRDWLREERLLD